MPEVVDAIHDRLETLKKASVCKTKLRSKKRSKDVDDISDDEIRVIGDK